MTKVPISDINLNIKTRFRQDLGELKPLIESIKRHGLLHPIVLSEDNQLICGRRRLAACMQLELKKLKLLTQVQQNLREAEADENNETIRKSFTVEEIAEIDEFFRDREEELRLKNDRKAGKLIPAGNLPRGRTRENIAKRVGVSDKTLEKIRTVKEASTEGECTKQIWKRVAAGKLKVDKAYNQVKRFQKTKEAEDFCKE